MKKKKKDKFTESRDGIRRRSFKIEVRLDFDTLMQIQEKCMNYEGRDNDKAVRAFLNCAVRTGIEDLLEGEYV